MRDQQMYMTKSLKVSINDAMSVTLSLMMPPKLRKKKKSSTALKEDIQAINVASPFPRKPSTGKGVESTEIAPSTKDREKKEELDIDDKHIEVIKDQEVFGSNFLLLSEEKLRSIGMSLRSATRIAEFAKEISGKIKHRYEELPEDLSNIIKNAVREEFFWQKPDVISVSKLSETMMKKIMDDIEIKTVKDFKEGQAMGELFLIDKLHPTNAITVLTDCNDNWIIYFFLKINEEQYMATSRIDDRKIKSITETVDARMADMVSDMSEQELYNMTARKRLMLVRDYCRLDEQLQVDQLIRQFSDNYENPPLMMFANANILDINK
ncbi:6350_t:CDS:2 [Funneliformis geosporum]|uniref:6350_t:CDS:1 n=1 Tax=Funneliformis geosporum TaxID=1117311 RepID=A0A9W4WXQ1_9GLOM|nr:6350_t:CDS:2 [Funneliformis geosporum]